MRTEFCGDPNSQRTIQEHLYAFCIRSVAVFFSTVHSETISRATAIIYSIIKETKAHVLGV